MSEEVDRTMNDLLASPKGARFPWPSEKEAAGKPPDGDDAGDDAPDERDEPAE